MILQSFHPRSVLHHATLLAVVLLGAPTARGISPPPLRAPHAAAAAGRPAARAAGVGRWRAGGTAAAAACAAALALGVASPPGSGVGGGGFAVVYVAREDKVYTLDFRERAPAA